MWLEVAITDATGRAVLESGTWDESTSSRLEDEQLRAYEARHGVRGEPGPHFILNDTIVSDTRIPPRGFAPEDGDGVHPVGRDYGDRAGGYRDHDVAPYVAALPCEIAGPLTIRVRLLQQTISREHVEFLRDDQSTSLGQERGATLYDAWERTGRAAPVVVNEITQDVPVSEAEGAGACVPDGGTGPDGGRGDGCCSVSPGADAGHGWVTFVLFGVMIAVRARRARRRRNE